MKARSFSLYLLYFWLIVFCFIPLLIVFIASFLSKDSMHLVSLPLTLENYTVLFTPVFAKILFRSLLIACITTLLCLLIAYPFSYLMIKSKHQSILLLLIIIPFWTSSLIRTYSLIAILKYKGILNAILLKLHWIETPLPLLYTNFAVIIGLVYNLFPFMVLPIFTNMERFDFRLIEAAKDLGANKWSIFTRVFLPNTAPGILSGCLLVLLPAMTLFYIPNILGGARSILLGNLIQNQFLVLGDWPEGSATSVVLTSMLLILMFVFRRQKSEVIR
ncbi:spermidine/putrescine ABC transporter permease [Legionella norrlandica]|uniref:Spermidine/putrescine ABC transporter permease n=1 Tax=Legionella norrlandica TaxID=1498499 RepID=A0A0A2T445_9GAMM|nr:ABC transporter permease subunit [Legionella norrlandica]KGP62198.1 spermidine/putrescine ABC transporter permease [Legionella norrlandica]